MLFRLQLPRQNAAKLTCFFSYTSDSHTRHARPRGHNAWVTPKQANSHLTHTCAIAISPTAMSVTDNEPRTPLRPRPGLQPTTSSARQESDVSSAATTTDSDKDIPKTSASTHTWNSCKNKRSSNCSRCHSHGEKSPIQFV